ncbi:hypothetical protein HN587_03305 [Candidatus Woesearchaeota archaeon]|jgi:hypothetical protein|nr:hypothetical protein [Candidatus Woesearchaeota archaeon]
MMRRKFLSDSVKNALALSWLSSEMQGCELTETGNEQRLDFTVAELFEHRFKFERGGQNFVLQLDVTSLSEHQYFEWSLLSGEEELGYLTGFVPEIETKLKPARITSTTTYMTGETIVHNRPDPDSQMDFIEGTNFKKLGGIYVNSRPDMAITYAEDSKGEYVVAVSNLKNLAPTIEPVHPLQYLIEQCVRTE